MSLNLKDFISHFYFVDLQNGKRLLTLKKCEWNNNVDLFTIHFIAKSLTERENKKLEKKIVHILTSIDYSFLLYSICS